jgi:hypothetical protein
MEGQACLESRWSALVGRELGGKLRRFATFKGAEAGVLAKLPRWIQNTASARDVFL